MEIPKKFETVNGVKVLSAERAKSPLSGLHSVNGEDIFYRKAIILNLEDGTTVAGCTFEDCTYTHAQPLTVTTKHYKVHVRRIDPRATAFLDWTLEEILGRLVDSEDDLDKVMAQRDKAIADKAAMRERVRELEADLADLDRLRKILGKKS